MSFVAQNPARYVGATVDDGQCVAYVQKVTDAPETKYWTRGSIVSGSSHPYGTAIATFDENGTYANNTDGSSHAAIYLAQNTDGISVLDQWVNHPVAPRTIRFKQGEGLPCDDGDAYYVIETAA
jgi:hypothetical protein